MAIYGLLAQWDLIGRFLGLVIGHAIGSIAYVVVIVSATLAGFDRSLERAAMSLGAGPLLTFRRVTFPLIRPQAPHQVIRILDLFAKASA